MKLICEPLYTAQNTSVVSRLVLHRILPFVRTKRLPRGVSLEMNHLELGIQIICVRNDNVRISNSLLEGYIVSLPHISPLINGTTDNKINVTLSQLLYMPVGIVT